MTQPGMFLSQPPKARRPSWFIAAGDDLDAVGDHLAGDEGVAHALVAHHDAVGGGWGAEDLRHAAGGADALAALAGQAVEVGVARGDVAEQARRRRSSGGSKSSSWKPTARSMARLGARPGPPVVVRLFRARDRPSPVLLVCGIGTGLASRLLPASGPGPAAGNRQVLRHWEKPTVGGKTGRPV